MALISTTYSEARNILIYFGLARALFHHVSVHVFPQLLLSRRERTFGCYWHRTLAHSLSNEHLAYCTVALTHI